ncbi:Protein-tyrosine phosphatase [Microdochium nivale]|nr:Protein-tyrosine phosphatase [Microdochium nivale]
MYPPSTWCAHQVSRLLPPLRFVRLTLLSAGKGKQKEARRQASPHSHTHDISASPSLCAAAAGPKPRFCLRLSSFWLHQGASPSSFIRSPSISVPAASRHTSSLAARSRCWCDVGTLPRACAALGPRLAPHTHSAHAHAQLQAAPAQHDPRLLCTMPHLSARFRRSRKKVPEHNVDSSTPFDSDGMTAPAADSDQARQPRLAFDDAHAQHDHPHDPSPAAALPPHDTSKHERQRTPPSLSVTTTTTTPPSSSHSDQSNSSIYSSKSAPSAGKGALHPLKSSFRGFHLRTNKRARSPAPASLHLQAPMISGNPVQAMNASSPLSASFPASPTAGDSEWHDPYRLQVPKKNMPAFLRLPYQEIESRFMDLQLQERARVMEGMGDNSPSGRFRSALPVDSRKLDRYQNIQPWANNRVKLKVPNGCLDYINASPIKVPSPLESVDRPDQNFIAMQGPKRETVEHAWRMVVEQLESPAVIVMLTETFEGIQEKCYPYFPRTIEEDPIQVGESDEFGDSFRAQVRCASVENLLDGAIEVRQIIIDVEGQDEDRVVWHLLYRKWPDFGVPSMEDIGSFLELMRLSREKNVHESNPRIVHCSAGVGRSGTFITLDSLMREVESGDLEDYDEHHTEDLVFKTVNSLREQRRVMVQSDAQYHFIHQVLRQQWFEKYGVVEGNGEPAAKRLELDNRPDPFCEA